MVRKVVVLGSINTDYVVVSPRLPGRGETVSGGRFFKAGGGKGANQAVAARRLGAECAMIGAVGQDAEGDAALAELAAEAVDCRFVYRKPLHSGVALIFVEQESGENEIVVAAGANSALTPEDVHGAAAAFDGASVLLTQLEVPIETVKAGMLLARQRGLITLLNPAPAVAPEAIAPLLPLADYISPNRHELGEMVRLPGEIAHLPATLAAGPEAAAVLASGVRGVFVTLGADGACFIAAGCRLVQPAFQVAPVDTVGAGDAFNGALAVGLAEGMAPAELLRFAAAAGAIAVTKPGARPSQPYRQEVEQLERQG